MQETIIIGSLIALCILTMNSTHDVSGDIMKTLGIITVCMLIGFVYVN